MYGMADDFPCISNMKLFNKPLKRHRHCDSSIISKQTLRLKRRLRSLYGALRPLRPTTANKTTKVFRCECFLSPQEVTDILTCVSNAGLQRYTNNPEQDIQNSYAVHTTAYLNTNNFIHLHLPWLKEKLHRLVDHANKSMRWGFDVHSSRFNIRVAEYHEMTEGGSLPDFDHYDIGSLITVDIMLQEPSRPPMQGALFQTLEYEEEIGSNSKSCNSSSVWTDHEFHPGDALVFVSHKFHRVTRLERDPNCDANINSSSSTSSNNSSRKVLVLEYWCGLERHCGHRCDLPSGHCGFIDDE